MENTRIIKILSIIIILCLILLVLKTKEKLTKISNVNHINLINSNTILPTYNQTNLKSNTVNSKENSKTILVFSNYDQIKQQKDNNNQELTNKTNQQQNTIKQETNNSKTNQENPIDQETTITESKKDVYIIEHKITENKYIHGKVKNNTNSIIKNLNITADCYDKDDNKVTTAHKWLSELGANETWKFEIWTSPDTVKYKNIKLIFE